MLAGGIVVAVAPALVESPSSATSTSITNLQAQARQIAGRIASIQTRIDVLSEEYDQAAARAAALAQQKRVDVAAYSAAASTVARDTVALHRQAVNAYVDAGGSANLATAFSKNASSLPAQQTYIAAASGALNTAIATLHNSQITLSARKASLAVAEAHANANASALASTRSTSTQLQSQLQGQLSGVRGSLEAAVQAAEARAQAQAQAAAAAQAAQAAQAAAAAGGTISSIGPNPSPTPSGGSGSAPSSGGSGGAAVAAAESQRGVPYVWAGATPGGGFDCSGLTMWAWGRAGVNLPHSAQGQYDSIEHVSSSQLQPGDLIFYASGGYIYHVVMYIGGGQIIQAEDTGTVIHTGPIPGGAMGYGRP